ncbi:DUF1217 domain-containing protein [Paracoccus sp. YIM 132242]|uniref:DUF1217 domain-containing protein n=1 Tax=Paracoccus lichenicola TaxID=2665644 RepID=A0A6L6HSM1_9RHOB|nr:DUF1217 domain-containing protein [Paracoccus lichenicola]MTE00298.1 DUF1217 domain-containing protein [Paracoccus lichenicola]
MTSAISIGISGIAGWRVLQRIETRQVEATAKDPVIQRATTYFRENLTEDTTAEDLVGDYKMLQVALGAFGLEDDISNKAFIRKVLESDIGDSASLVNRLSDKRYLKLATEFQNRTDPETMADTVTKAYVAHRFQQRVGEGDESYRLALNARDELQAFATRTSSDKTMWYEVLGNEALREVFQGAFGFGSAMANLSVDRQLEDFMSASERILGSSSFAEIGTDEGIDKLVTRYLALSQVQSTTSSNRYSAALTLLSS